LQEAFKKLNDNYEALFDEVNNNQKSRTSIKELITTPFKRSEEQPTQRKNQAPARTPKGHEKHEREQVAEPDKVIELRVKSMLQVLC